MTKKSLTHAPGFITAMIVGSKRYELYIPFAKGDQISFDYCFTTDIADELLKMDPALPIEELQAGLIKAAEANTGSSLILPHDGTGTIE